MLTPDDCALLLEPLIAGLVEDPPWGQFIDRLRARLAADYTSITFRPFAHGTAPVSTIPASAIPGAEDGPPSRVFHLASGRQSPPIVARLYRTSLYADDPLPYHEMQDGRVYALHELLRVGDPAHDAYRAKLLAPSGMNVLLIMRVEELSGVSAWLTFTRESVDFGNEEVALVAALAPFLRAALAAFVAQERERTAARVASEAVRLMNFGWFTLDGEGRILDCDAHGAELLAGSGILRRGRRRLGARQPAVDREITGAIHLLATHPQSRPRAIVLNREPWLDMLLVPAAPAPGRARPAHALIAYVHADSWSSADRCDQLGQMFDLLPSEARLALALSRGMSIAEAALDLGLTVESARTYSKRIYAKTGARGQADLVRFIHRSILAIA
jgi:DNA-binding CsgD family transcriptional regulator